MKPSVTGIAPISKAQTIEYSFSSRRKRFRKKKPSRVKIAPSSRLTAISLPESGSGIGVPSAPSGAI
ncbi:hypothetical protein D3C80_1329840 [compost metagenome]